MDGITSSDSNSCLEIVSNSSHLPVKINTRTSIAQIYVDKTMNIKPLAQCLKINSSTPKIINILHVDDNDLNLRHCKTLPHHVKLTDPNKIVAINQYQPF